MALALTVTALLLLLVSVMVWRCWNLPSVPAIRLWAIGFAGMSVNYLDQFWRAEAWKKETEKLEIKLQGRRLPRQRKKVSFVEGVEILDADARFLLPQSAVQFLLVTTQFEPDIAVRISVLAGRCQRLAVGLQNIAHTRSVFQSAFGDSWSSLLPPLKIALCQPRFYPTELHLDNREPTMEFRTGRGYDRRLYGSETNVE